MKSCDINNPAPGSGRQDHAPMQTHESGYSGFCALAESLDIDLKGHNLEYAHLTNVNFSEGKLMKTSFFRAKLAGSDFSKVMARDASFQEADMTSCNFHKANLKHTGMVKAIFKDADLSKADLEKAFMPYSDMRNCNLSGASIVKATLEGCDMSGANLLDCKWRHAWFQSTKLHGTILPEDFDHPQMHTNGIIFYYRDEPIPKKMTKLTDSEQALEDLRNARKRSASS